MKRPVINLTNIITQPGILDLAPDLQPRIRHRRHHRDKPTEDKIRPRAHDEPAEIVQVVEILRSQRRRLPARRLTDRAHEPDDIDEDARDVRRVGAPVEAEGVVVGPRLLGAVEVLDLVVALADEVVVADHDAGDGGEEDGVGGEVGGEVVGAREEVPGTHGQADAGADVATAADVDVFRQQGRHVGAAGDGVGGDVGAELGEDEGGGNEEDSGAVARAALPEEGGEEVERVPDRIAAEDNDGGGGDDDTDEGGDGEAERDGEELRPEGILWSAGETGEVGVVGDEGGEVGDAGHDALDDGPCQCGAVEGGLLVDDGAGSFGAHEGPDEEGDAGCGDHVGLGGEEMADFVDWWIDCWQGDEPEDEEGDEIPGVGTRRCGHGVARGAKGCVRGPDGGDHEGDALSADPRLHSVPDSCHSCAVEDGP